MNNKAEDRALAKLARTSFARTPMEVGELQVHCVDGYIELSGKVRTPRGHGGDINFKKEMESLKQHIRALRGVKDVHDTRVLIIS